MEERMSNGDGAAANGLPPTFSFADSQAVVDYVTNVLEVTLGASREELSGPGSLLHDELLLETLSRCQRFASESQMSLYVLRQASPSLQNGDTNGDAAHSRDTYALSSEVSYSSRTTGCVAFLKKPAPISPDCPINRQVSVVNLPLPGSSVVSQTGATSSPYESLHALVRGALTPLFEAAARNAEPASEKLRSDGEARTGVSGARRKLADLEVSLQNLQQNIEVEAPKLQIHEVVQVLLEEASGDPQLAAMHIPEEAVSDSMLLNRLQGSANDWIKQIREFTKIADERPVGSTTQEKNFWLAMEGAIDGIEAQLAGGGVFLTLKVLEKAKRHGITASFSSDTKLKECKDRVQKYNTLFHGFPVEELLSATSVEKLRDALDDVFSHLNKKLRVCPYPVRRALPLVEAISADLNARLHDLLHGPTLMHMNIDDFKNQISQVEEVWAFWDEDVKEFTNVAREVTRRRNDKFIPIKIMKRHDKTQDRLNYISTFRDNHDQLQRTIVNVLGPEDNALDALDSVAEPVVVEEIGDVDAVEEIAQAYLAVKDVDVLDISPEGERLWTRAEAAYNERTARVENSIIARLRDRLAVAKSANEMFRVFSKFNSLFVRPKIRGAIAEYQVQLISNVRDDIETLQKRFTHQYGQSEAHAMAQLHDLPPISGAIIRARQIERQLNSYMSKVGDILGPKWAQHTDGQKLSVLSEGFRRKLDAKPVFDDWLRDISRRHLSINGRLFAITQNRARGNVLDIQVNFDSQIITLFKEVRNLLWLNFPVPHAITNVSKDARRVYPFAVSLMESLSTLAHTNAAIDGLSDVTLLLCGFRNNVHSLIGKGTSLKWESFVLAYDVHVRQVGEDGVKTSSLDDKLHVQFVKNLGNAVTTLQGKVTTLSTIQLSVNAILQELQTCNFSPEAFRGHLEALQRAIDQMNLEGYSNIAYWVAKTNDIVIETLRARLQQALKDWSDEFEHGIDTAPASKHEVGAPNVQTHAHDIVMQNQMIQLEPPLEEARAGWLADLHAWLGTLCQLPRIQASRFENALTFGTSGAASTYSELPLMCMDTLANLYESIEAKLGAAQVYVDEWLHFQSLWDLQLDQIQDDLDAELDLWLQLILEIRQKRDTFDTSGSQRSFGHLIVNYEQVQTKVNAKYDQWQHDLLGHFSGLFAIRLVDV
ncbi:dynein heavy chain, partial [Teratosphaeriaceae sp. CCFEE 6253]